MSSSTSSTVPGWCWVHWVPGPGQKLLSQLSGLGHRAAGPGGRLRDWSCLYVQQPPFNVLAPSSAYLGITVKFEQVFLHVFLEMFTKFDS